jgi:2-dehydro-3-deoxygalactonokinase
LQQPRIGTLPEIFYIYQPAISGMRPIRVLFAIFRLMKKHLLLCDWGSSSFRLGLYSLVEEKLIDEIQSGEGISGIYRDWEKSNNGTSKETLFNNILLKQAAILSGRTGIDLANIPVLISGMASSSIGMANLPYAGTPFNLDGSQVKMRSLPAQENFPHTVILISGVEAGQEVMRGEETQLIGIWSLLSQTGIRPGEAIFILPGTHSKHIYVKDEHLLQFKSFMTGELYQVIGNYSMLKDSITMETDPAPAANSLQAFKEGVQHSLKAGLLNALFTVRTNQLFKRWNKMENAFYLSGLLIGSELQELRQAAPCPLFLCSGKHLYSLYKIAMDELGLAERTNFISPEMISQAAMTGQKIIYTHHLKATAHE